MSFADYAYEEIMIEGYMISESVEKYVKHYSPQRVVNDAIRSFRGRKVDEEKKRETVSRDILKTIARTKNMSDKQKRCLVKMLVLREEDGYKIQ